MDNVFALIKCKHTEKVYVREDAIFKACEDAKHNNCYVFGEVLHNGDEWVVRERSQFLPYDKSEDIFEYYTSRHYVPEDEDYYLTWLKAPVSCLFAPETGAFFIMIYNSILHYFI